MGKVRTPALFISHGSPMIAIEDDAFTAAVAHIGGRLKPSAVVVMSAHWEATIPIRVNAHPQPPLIYDFGGFPQDLFDKKYPCPGSPQVAQRAIALLEKAGLKAEKEAHRGLDHGVWAPLCRIFPQANIPIVEISVPGPRLPRMVFEMGKALAPLREEGVVLMGTGGIVHNLRLLKFGQKNAPVDDWAKTYDQWVKEKLEQRDWAALMNYYEEGPYADAAVQGPEHFDPLLFVLGASHNDPIQTIYEGFHYGNLSMRSIWVGND